MPSLIFRRRFDLTTLPSDWSVVRVSLDWAGNPLMLLAEGKPPAPAQDDTAQAWALWFRAPARAHHLLSWNGSRTNTLRFSDSQNLFIFHVQPLGDEWLLAERRQGRATVYTSQGRVAGTLDLGDASEDLQTTPDGKIWVSYFAEGVTGNGIGREGVVCFNSAGEPLFRYRDFAGRHGLPAIHDGNAINVTGGGEIWLNYASEFPLVLLRNSEPGSAEAGLAPAGTLEHGSLPSNGQQPGDSLLEGHWPRFGPMGNSFAVRGMEAVFLREGLWTRLALDNDSPPELMEAVDELGFPLPEIATQWPSIAARGASLIVRAGNFLYELLDD